MIELKTVKEAAPDPKTGKPRPKSGVSVPYYDLDQSIAVAKAIHEQAGGSCTREQMAQLLKYSGTNNGGFLTRISAAKLFGLVEESGESIRITHRAKNILSPVMPTDADCAKVEAFLSVDFFSKFYERFKGTTLPQEAGIKNLLLNTYSVVPGRIVPSLRSLMDSAEQAGFFKTSGNRSRMIVPLGLTESSNNEKTPVDDTSQTNGNEDANSKRDSKLKSDGTGGGDGGRTPEHDVHRFELPVPGKESVIVLIPKSLDAEDWEMFQEMFSIYVKRWKGYAPKANTPKTNSEQPK